MHNETSKFRFLKWPMYQDAKEMVKMVFSISKHLPREYERSLSDQMNRASLSVALNIAEGSGKSSDKDLNHYFQIALGSLYEVFAASDILRDFKLINDKEIDNLQHKLMDVANQLVGFKKKLSGYK